MGVGDEKPSAGRIWILRGRGVMFCLRKKRFSGGARIVEEEVARKRYEQRERENERILILDSEKKRRVEKRGGHF